MQARVIQGSSGDFNSLIYGAPSKSTVRYIQERTQHYLDSGSGQATRLRDNILDLVDSYIGHDSLRRAKSLARRADAVFTPDDIRILRDIGKIQQAKPRMQRWIMSDPTIREMAHLQRIEGFVGTYYDNDVGRWGQWHRDHELLHDGLITEDPDNPELEVFSSWIEELDDDDDLDLEDQLDIMETIEATKEYIALGGEDPTSKTNASL